MKKRMRLLFIGLFSMLLILLPMFSLNKRVSASRQLSQSQKGKNSQDQTNISNQESSTNTKQSNTQEGAVATQDVDLDDDEDNEDADLPPFARNMISKKDYLRKRDAHVKLLRGLPYNLPYNPRVRAIEQMQRQEAEISPLISRTSWTAIGPTPIPNGQTTSISTAVSGRTTAIVIHPTNPNIVYVGTAQGGVYRSTNGGTSWTPIMDSALSLAIGSLALDPTDPTTLLVGTGEGNLSADSFFGVGLYIIKTADTSPNLTGPFNLSTGGTDIFTNRSIVSIVVSPTDHNIIFCATSSGVGGIGGNTGIVLPPRNLYRALNTFQTGGPTFTSLNVVPANTNVIVTSALLDPNDPNVLLCSVFGQVSGQGGIYRSTNALATTPTFTKVLSYANSINVKLNAVKVGTTVTILSASGEAVTGCTAGAAGTLRRSTDEGATWSSPITTANGFCGGQCFYDLPVAMDPSNANNILIGGPGNSGSSNPCRGSVFMKSTDGTNFVRSDVGLHADEHAIAFAPSNTSIVYTGNDGGIFKSTDGGSSWTSLNNTDFSATQFQSIALHPTDTTFQLGGSQDNGTELRMPNGSWTRADFGDGGFALIDQSATDTTNVTMYHTYFNQTGNFIGFARVNKSACATEGQWAFRGGGIVDPTIGCEGVALGANNGISTADSVLFYAPMALGPGTPNTLYFGTNKLYRSTNRGDTMTAVSQTFATTVSAIGISPQNDNFRIVGLSNGSVFATVTGSTTLTSIPTGITNYAARVVFDPNDTTGNTAYVTYAGFGLTTGRHVLKITNLASTPTVQTAGGSTNAIPDVPVNAFVIDPQNSNNLYAGTDIGVYASTDGGANWAPFGTGLPRVAIFDMAIQNSGRILRVATHGRSSYEISIATCPTITLSPTTLPAGAAGIAYSQTITASPSGSYSFSVTSGTLPTGITLSTAGVLSGTTSQLGNFTFTVTATDNLACMGSQNYTLTINPGTATHFTVSAPSSATAGTAFNFTVTALDQFNNTATSYTGTVRFTSTDTAATLPANSTLTSGTGTFSATLKTAGSRTITATDTVSSTITGTSNSITVAATTATHFTVSAPSSATAGTAFNFTVTALDQFNNTATSYTGTVRFTSTDTAATLPANSTLTSGTGTFSATLRTAGGQTITATDTVSSIISGTSNSIIVGKTATTTTLTSSPNPSIFGQLVTLNATVSSTSLGLGTPTGTVTFMDGTTVIGTAQTLVNGVASTSSSSLSLGSHSITAVYSGDNTFNGSTSNTITQMVIQVLDHNYLLVADTANNRIQKSTNEGANWITISKGAGTTLGTFNAPKAVTGDSTGNLIFAADTGNNRVQRSTDGGTTWTLLAGPGISIGQVNAPEGLAYDEINDKLYIADTLNNRIQVVSSISKSPAFAIYANSAIGTALGQFNSPTGIAVNSTGGVYVCDTNNNRIQFNATGVAGAWTLFASAGTALGQVNAPRAIYVDGQGKIFIADTNNNRIQMVVGTSPTLFMGPGTALGTVNGPKGVTKSSAGNVFIGDTLNNRIQLKPVAGGSATVVGAPGTGSGQFNQPSGLR